MRGFAAGKRLVWEEIAKLPQRSRKKAAISYFTSDAKLKFGKGDLLIVDASKATIAGRLTSAKQLHAAQRRGASIIHVVGLHAKVIVLNSRTLVVGSMNASASSANRLIEAAIVTDDQVLVDQAELWIDEIAETVAPLTDDEMQDLLKIKLRKRTQLPPAARDDLPSARPRKTPRTLYAGGTARAMRSEDAKIADQELEELAETLTPAFESRYWIFWKPTRAVLEVRVGDDLFLGIRESEHDPVLVYPLCRIVKIRRSRKTGALIIHYVYRLRDKTLPFAKFAAELKKSEIGIKQFSAGMPIPDEVAALVRRRWPR